MVGPARELLDRVLVAFGAELDAPVGTVTDPPRNTEPPGLALRRGTEKDTLDPATDDELNSFLGHDVASTSGAPLGLRPNHPQGEDLAPG